LTQQLHTAKFIRVVAGSCE